MTKTLNQLLLLFSAVTFYCCTKTGDSSMAGPGTSRLYSGTGGGAGGGQNNPGVITAGEWNDLENWTFWDSLAKVPEFAKYSTHWSFYNNNRISVRLRSGNGNPVANASVQLTKGSSIIFNARTDNFGRAELWADLFAYNPVQSTAGYRLSVNNGAVVSDAVKSYKEGVNELSLLNATPATGKIEIAFVVDATGSMGDELSYLQTELRDVINRVHTSHPASAILTSAVFYRDKGDEYETRVSPFATNPQTTLDFIKLQKADGGGDFPEAVHTALEKAVNELQWSADGRTRILFLLLDAPPHHKSDVVASIQNNVTKAAGKGIKIIPITASGIDKETEFLMRYMALTTNGSYVFITNHSGVGGNHIAATVGPYQVEYLNNLTVRLINKYVQ